MTSLPPFRLLDPAVLENPYPAFRRYREAGPVHRSATGPWYLFSYDACHAALRHPALGSDPSRVAPLPPPEPRHAAYRLWEAQTMLRRDPPDHTRLRALVSRAFTPRMVEGLRPRTRQIVDELLDAADAAGRLELIGDLALPLPMLVIAELLGVPAEDRALLKGWSSGLFTALDVYLPEDEDAVLARASAAAEAFASYLRALIAERRRAPREDLLSALVRIEEQGDRLSEDELVTMGLLLLSAGHETTTNLIGNGMLALLSHPEQLALLRRVPGLLEAAVDELLRYDSPVQVVARWALEDTVIGGQAVARGETVVPLLGAANRDPAVFAEPDRLDIRRSGPRALTFGHGIHFCLGAPLARVEGQVAIEALLRRYPRLALSGAAPAWGGSPVFRGLRALPLAV